MVGAGIQAKRIPLTPAEIGLSVCHNEVGQSGREQKTYGKRASLRALFLFSQL
jgi:hypothetical protein